MAHEIIGRREELIALGAFLDSVPAGGSALLFEGDAGIGKSALWQEGVRLARERGFRVLAAHSSQSEVRTAFATLGDLFAPVLGETLQRLVPVQRRALEIAFLIREPEGPPPETRLLATALLSVVCAVAEDGPLVLALDDVQWVDASSVDIIRFMLRRLEGEPVGVLASVRGRPVAASLELDRAFAAFRRVPVTPLSVAAIHRLLWGRLSLNLSRPVLLRVHETVGGNPFFALELGRAVVDGTIRPEGEHLPLPENLIEVVAKRLSALPAQVRDTLTAVAALGAPSVTLLEPLTSTAVDDIDLARQRGVLQLDGDRISFTHPLLAPVCYQEMPLHKRRGLHRRLADLDVDLEERARHLAISVVGHDEEVAAALDAAATHAHRRGAVQAAAELAERAVALTPPDAVDTLNRRQITAAGHYYYGGDAKKATELLEAAISSSEPGPVRAEALGQLAVVISAREGARASEGLQVRALAEPGLENRQRVFILCGLVWNVGSRGESRAAVCYAEEGLALAEELAEPHMLGYALTTVAEATYWHTGRILRDALDRAMELERVAGGHDRVSTGSRGTLAWLLANSGRYAEARALWSDLIADATERGAGELVWPMFWLARLELAIGAWDEAARLCDEAMGLGHQVGRELVDLLCLMIQAEVDAYRGEAEKARRGLAELLRVAERAGIGRYLQGLDRSLALLELSCGDAAASSRHVAPLFTDVPELDEWLAHLAGSVAIEALIAVGDLLAAERLLVLLDEHIAETGPDTALLPLAHRCRGILRAAHGDHERAIAALEAAAAEPDPPQEVNPFELARALLALGTVQRKAQHKRAAHESLQRAAEIFEQLGACIWSENARSELRRIGGRTVSGEALSETERCIVELVIAGRRNREVAAELSLSPNTVAWNLSKIYRKLGVSSRTELAAHVAATPPA